MTIISDNGYLNKNTKSRDKKNPIIKPESIEYDSTFENNIRPKDRSERVRKTNIILIFKHRLILDLIFNKKIIILGNK